MLISALILIGRGAHPIRARRLSGGVRRRESCHARLENEARLWFHPRDRAAPYSDSVRRGYGRSEEDATVNNGLRTPKRSTRHEIVPGDARQMAFLPEAAADLIVTSPPYPMIEMWDGVFSSLSPEAGAALARADGPAAFEAMHAELDRAWEECFRVLRPGGLACINIGDATRTLGGVFRLWPNHARLLATAARIGFHVLPDILWRKQTNAPNKFLGSGMLPAGAYVTYEHEYVLILRKGEKRIFATAATSAARRQSAFFWEERNVWFSDVWTDLKGARQELGAAEARARSGAFPLELAYRLINMFSLQGDTVLDPFLGTGTTMAAAIAAGRNSIGVERDAALIPSIRETVAAARRAGRERVARRLAEHLAFVEERLAAVKPLRHTNEHYGFPVITRQETDLRLLIPRSVSAVGDHCFEVAHADAKALLAEAHRPRQLSFLGAGANPRVLPPAPLPAPSS
jgi:DNA modification methylase